MFALIAGWLILSAAIWATAAILPGVKIDGFGTAAGVAAVFSLLNYLFGWIVFTLIGLATLGLGFVLFFITQWIVNAIMLSVTDKLFGSFHLSGFRWALIASLFISLFASFGQWLVF